MLDIEKNLKSQKLIVDKIDSYIGIDFGHAETSAAYILRDDEKKIKSSVGILRTNLAVDSIVPSVIGFKGTKTEIGIRGVSQNMDKVFLSYKKRPQLASTIERRCMQEFMKKYYLSLLQNNSNLLTPKQHAVVISVPSDWEINNVSLYRKMAIKAGIPCVDVTYESNAAMHYINNCNDTAKIGTKDKQRGIIVLDFGSSTFDLSYIKIQDKTKGYIARHDSYELGASYIEKKLVEILKPQWNNYDTIIEQHPSIQSWVELMMRKKVKEEYFNEITAKQEPQEVNQVFNVGTEFFNGDPQYGKLKYYITVDERIMNDALANISIPKITETGSFEILIIKTLNHFFENTGKDICSIAKIIITGGASRMLFLQEVVKNYFKTSKFGITFNNMIFDNNPSYAISKGVALWCRSRIESLKYSSQLDTLLDNYFKYISTTDIESSLNDKIKVGSWQEIETFLQCYINYYWEVPEDTKSSSCDTGEPFRKTISNKVCTYLNSNLESKLTQCCNIEIENKKYLFLNTSFVNFVKNRINTNYVLADIPTTNFKQPLQIPSINIQYLIGQYAFAYDYIIKPDNLKEKRKEKVIKNKEAILLQINNEVNNQVFNYENINALKEEIRKACIMSTKKVALDLIERELAAQQIIM